MVFSNLLIVGIRSFVIMRISMSIVAGLMAGAGAALVRDMSPRLSRALAFGLLTIGPVGSNFLANYIAGVTLPIYQTWQSQMWIMGFLAIAMYIPILLLLWDLSPELRMKIMKTEIQALAAEGRRPPPNFRPARGEAFCRCSVIWKPGCWWSVHHQPRAVHRDPGLRAADVHRVISLHAGRSRRDERGSGAATSSR